jgi:hypothetical protein
MPRRPAPPLPSAADYLDALRDRVEASGLSHAELGRRLDPPMARSQVRRCLLSEDLPLSSVVRIAAGLGLTLADLVED